jgi:hypothetical protein
MLSAMSPHDRHTLRMGTSIHLEMAMVGLYIVFINAETNDGF